MILRSPSHDNILSFHAAAPAAKSRDGGTDGLNKSVSNRSLPLSLANLSHELSGDGFSSEQQQQQQQQKARLSDSLLQHGGIPNALPSKFQLPSTAAAASSSTGILKSASFGSINSLLAKANQIESPFTLQARAQNATKARDNAKRRDRNSYPERSLHREAIARSQENLSRALELSRSRDEMTLHPNDASSVTPSSSLSPQPPQNHFESDSLRRHAKRPQSAQELLTSSTGDLLKTETLHKYDDVTDVNQLQHMVCI